MYSYPGRCPLLTTGTEHFRVTTASTHGLIISRAGYCSRYRERISVPWSPFPNKRLPVTWARVQSYRLWHFIDVRKSIGRRLLWEMDSFPTRFLLVRSKVLVTKQYKQRMAWGAVTEFPRQWRRQPFLSRSVLIYRVLIWCWTGRDTTLSSSGRVTVVVLSVHGYRGS